MLSIVLSQEPIKTQVLQVLLGRRYAFFLRFACAMSCFHFSLLLFLLPPAYQNHFFFPLVISHSFFLSYNSLIPPLLIFAHLSLIYGCCIFQINSYMFTIFISYIIFYYSPSYSILPSSFPLLFSF